MLAQLFEDGCEDITLQDLMYFVDALTLNPDALLNE